MITKTLIQSLVCTVGLVWALVAGWGCRPSAMTQVQLQALGTDVLLGDGLALMVPPGFAATSSPMGRIFHRRSGDKRAYDAIVIERREEGHQALLDGALETLLGQLEPLEHFDLLDVQLSYVGRHLALSYAVDFAHLEVHRRQWGILIGTDTGLVAIVMTSPKDVFHEATDDYLSLLGSLHAAAAPHAAVRAGEPQTEQGHP